MLAVAIMAAGKGTRMKSSIPKVLQTISSKTLITRVIESFQPLKPKRSFVIVGHQSELVINSLKQHEGLEFVLQQPQNGTGHAIQQLTNELENFEGDLLVLNGDVPLISSHTLSSLVRSHTQNGSGATILTAYKNNPNGYGRVFVGKNGQVDKIKEDKDCNNEEAQNKLINAGIYCFNWNKLQEVLPRLSANNTQKELYITDCISLIDNCTHIVVEDADEIDGINDQIQMESCNAKLQKKLRESWMKEGVKFIDGESCTLSDNCKFGKNVVIEPQTHFRGECVVGDNSTIGPGSLIEDSNIGNWVTVKFSVIEKSYIGDKTQVGPYSHIRPRSSIEENCKIGNFVEIKKSIVGAGSKINHLSYIGDSTLGVDVNIGAGTITANYDGKFKHQTIIGKETKTGANSVLVAPLVLGERVTIGAGSTITKDIPAGSLGIGRSKQQIKNNWDKN